MGWQQPLADKKQSFGDSLLLFVFFVLTQFLRRAPYLGSDERLAFMLGLQDSTESMIKMLPTAKRTFIETDISLISPKT